MTTVDDVKKILDTTLDDDGIEFYVEVAGDILTSRIGDDLPGLDSDLVNRLTVLVTCHTIHASDPQSSQSDTGDHSNRYLGPDDLPGLHETRFGRRAVELDPTGKLGGDESDTQVFEAFPDI